MKLFGKKSKVLAAAIAMMTLSTAAAVTGTVAWFTANNMVNVTGMAVKTKVSDNLLIADITSKNADDSYYKSELTQVRTALLEPASTTNGTNYFYHSSSNIAGDGHAEDTTFVAYNESVELANTKANKDNVDYNFNKSYNIKGTGTTDTGNEQADWISNVLAADMNNSVAPAYAYIDYEFYLKATSTIDNQVIRMTDCNLLKDGAVIKDYAWRVAVLSQEVAKGAPGSGVGSLNSILKHTSGDYFTTEQAVTSTSGRAAVSKLGTAVEIENHLDSGATQRYKVVVRLWLEGEDKSCNNDTYASLSSASWSLSIKFELGAASGTGAIAGVQAINSVTA